MKPEKILKKVFEKYKFADYPFNSTLDATLEAMEEYVNYKIDKIFNESINVKHFQDQHRFISLSEYKEEILQQIKNK